MYNHIYYQQSESEIVTQIETSQSLGLFTKEIVKRREDHGINKIDDVKNKGPLRILLSQFKNLLVLVLVVAALIAGFLGESQDTIVIVILVIVNAALGFWQEYQAERAMMALKELASPNAKVKRDGKILIVPSQDLVVGDIVLLEAGNIIPADLRLIEAFQFNIDESTLTGESLSVNKVSHAMAPKELAITEQKNMVFKGTLATNGRAVGVVVSVGMSTELGQIAKLLKDEKEVKTPLQKRIDQFAKVLSIIVIALCFIIFIIGLVRGEEVVLMFMTSLSLAVAGIPEALPAIVTISLALGSKTLSKKNSLIRKLTAVETLGSVTYICSDKTGTLTENKMQAKSFFINDQVVSNVPDNAFDDFVWSTLIKAMTLNNDVTFGKDGQAQGDPTEVALIKVPIELGQDKKSLLEVLPRVAELPFSSERAMMSTIHSNLKESIIYSKGTPEKILSLCHNQYGKNGITLIDRESLLQASQKMAAQGFRVIAFAYRTMDKNSSEIELNEFEKNLIFIGLVGLIDPPRKDAKEAIELCKSAGIKVVMITGDHPSTAKAIAIDLGILLNENEKVVQGSDLQNVTEENLKKLVQETKVYARVLPEQKIKIVKALQSAGEIVAMTGDGVNDAPALKKADIGIAMGKGGTDVAREASDLILLDDNFTTIVIAVREGRRIYDNIRKFIRFSLTGNSGEIWTLFLALFIGLPTPLLPIQILWVNLVTDGLPGLALAFEPKEKGIMVRAPRKPNESIFADGLWQHTLWVGLLTAAATLGTLAWAYHSGSSHWQSMAFTVLTFVQMGHVLAIRSEKQSFFSLGLKSNLPLFFTVLFTLALQLVTLYSPLFQKVLKTQALSYMELAVCLVASTSVFIAVEVEKWILRQA